jgi:hypothetical protein
MRFFVTCVTNPLTGKSTMAFLALQHAAFIEITRLNGVRYPVGI